MQYSTIMNIMPMSYPALEHQALYFFDYLPDFSKTWNLKQNLKTFNNKICKKGLIYNFVECLQLQWNKKGKDF